MPLQGKEFLASFKNRLSSAIAKIAAAGLDDLKAEVSTSGPQTSSPGSPPHEQSGGLEAGLSVQTDGGNITFTSSAPYSGEVEFGTSQMAPRPFMRPMIKKLKRSFLPDMAKELGK